MSEFNVIRRIYLAPSLTGVVLDDRLRQLGGDFSDGDAVGTSVVVSSARWLIENSGAGLPSWVDQDTRYLVVADVAESATLRLPAILGLHKPHIRLHISRDPGVVKRLLLAQARSVSWEGIVDAYVLLERLVVVLGDMTIREFPKARLPKVGRMGAEDFERFVVDSSGSYLHWPEGDVHLGASQLLQAVDPMYLTDVEIQRYAKEKVSLALLDMRNERGLKQTDIVGLSDRHVRRLENEEIRLTVDVAEKYAVAFGLDLSEFLAELGRHLTALRDSAPTSHPPTMTVGAG